MAQFEFSKGATPCLLFGAKTSVVLITVFLLSTVNARSINSSPEGKLQSTGVLKITDDLPTDEPSSRNAAAIDADRRNYSLVGEFLNILTQLSNESSLVVEEMQADQPTMEREGKSFSFNETLERKKQERLWAIQMETLRRTGWLDKLNLSLSETSFPAIPAPAHTITIPTLPTLTKSTHTYKREAVPPICPHKNDENLTVTFNISEPKASSKDLILNVLSAELKLYKMPFGAQLNKKLHIEDEPIMSKWKETFQKSNIRASERVIDAKADEEKMIQFTVYKVRNKHQHKTMDLKKLDTKMLPASFQGMTTWNITKAINVWGNDTKRTLNLVITVEDDDGNKLSTRDIFKMKCANNLEKPNPLITNETISDRSHTVWINLTTEEIPARTVAINGAVESINHYTGEDYRSGSRRGEPNRNKQRSQSKESASLEDRFMDYMP